MEPKIQGYHAHVYFDAKTAKKAAELCGKAQIMLYVRMGQFHRKPVGPHPMWSCQLAFSAKHFEKVVPWLVQNRGDLTVFVHTLTGDDVYDHTQGVMWLGESQKLDLSIFGI